MTEKGPIQMLCDEIGAVFTERMESPAVLVAFIAVLVDEIEHVMEVDDCISGLIGKPVSGEARDALICVKRLAAMNGRSELIRWAKDAHETMRGTDDGSCGPYIEMLNSCVCAIRFGLEVPCNSRWPAEAASHIWRKKYGVSLFDHHSNKWGKQWARDKFYESLA